MDRSGASRIDGTFKSGSAFQSLRVQSFPPPPPAGSLRSALNAGDSTRSPRALSVRRRLLAEAKRQGLIHSPPGWGGWGG